MGDSITAYWPLLDNNVGVPGDHTDNMVHRFPTAVLGNGYARVGILGGTNDILYPISDSGDALSAIASMAQMGRAANMQVIL